MPYSICGCWYGAWNSITNPPVCDFHQQYPEAPFPHNVDTATGTGILPYMYIPTQTSPMTGTRLIGGTLGEHARLNPRRTLEENIWFVIFDLTGKANEAQAAGEIAAHDKWQEALQVVMHLQQVIKEAEAAKTVDDCPAVPVRTEFEAVSHLIQYLKDLKVDPENVYLPPADNDD